MIRITDAFTAEHAVFYAQFAALEATLPTAGLPELRAQVALLAAALGSHAELEDELLFGPLLGLLDDADAAGVALLADEHRSVRGELQRLRDADDPVEARGRFLAAIAVAREHSRREEETYFPLAAERLGDEQLAQLGRLWAARRGVRIG